MRRLCEIPGVKKFYAPLLLVWSQYFFYSFNFCYVDTFCWCPEQTFYQQRERGYNKNFFYELYYKMVK